jgi:uncharacterized protein (TIGR02172 family)
MEVTITHDTVTRISIRGSVTSANAPELEKAVAGEPGEAKEIRIDAEGLEYISSAGLRVLLALKKRCGGKKFRIVQVNEDVMNIFDVTGFSEIMDISKARKKISIDNCVKIGAGACGEVYRLDAERIIKLYYPAVKEEEIRQEKNLARKAFVLGVPTAISYDIVEVEGRTGVVYELIDSKTLGELFRENPDQLDQYVEMYAGVCRQIHSIQVEEGELPSFKDLNRADIPNIRGITEEESAYLYEFLDLVPDRRGCVHGDLNVNNIMVQKGECCLIDMGEFSMGSPLFDISRILFSIRYAAEGENGFNIFYKMPQATMNRILSLLLKKYFQAETLEEAMQKDPDLEWLYPMAWFRCCTCLLKGERWPKEKRELALQLLQEELIPFIISHRKE